MRRRATRPRSPGRVAGSIQVIGYEAAGNVIVTVGHGFGRGDMPGLPSHSTTLRVPLAGSGRPAVIRGQVDVAW